MAGWIILLLTGKEFASRERQIVVNGGDGVAEECVVGLW